MLNVETVPKEAGLMLFPNNTENFYYQVKRVGSHSFGLLYQRKYARTFDRSGKSFTCGLKFFENVPIREMKVETNRERKMNLQKLEKEIESLAFEMIEAEDRELEKLQYKMEALEAQQESLLAKVKKTYNVEG